jgi:hypothetical protein
MVPKFVTGTHGEQSPISIFLTSGTGPPVSSLVFGFTLTILKRVLNKGSFSFG